jgi:hypothetical protein
MKTRVAFRFAAMSSPIAVLAAILFLLPGCKPSNEAPTAADNTSPAAGSASITASPNPIPPTGDRTTISWNTGDGSVGEIWVSVNGAEPKLFAQEVKGSSVANWIGPGEKADFVLYSGSGRQKEIAKVTVAHTK